MNIAIKRPISYLICLVESIGEYMDKKDFYDEAISKNPEVKGTIREPNFKNILEGKVNRIK